jgi:hypothetical protein
MQRTLHRDFYFAAVTKVVGLTLLLLAAGAPV